MAAREALATVEVRCYLHLLLRGPEYLLRRKDKSQFIERAVVIAVSDLLIDEVVEDSTRRATIDEAFAEGVAANDGLFRAIFG